MSAGERRGVEGPVEAPPRLAEGHDLAAEGLRALALHVRPDARAEVIAWGRVADRAAAGAARRWLWSGAFVTAGVIAAIWIARAPAPIATAPVASPPSSVAARAPAVPSAVGPVVIAASAPRANPVRGEAGAGEAKGGAATAGVATVGEAKAGEAKAVASTAAQAPAGEAKVGEAKVGEAKVGEAKAGEAPRDERDEIVPPRVALSRRPVPLAVGRAALAAEATVDVARGTSARASADAAWVRVVLERGEVGLHVAKRVAGGPGFEVVAGTYHFRVLGTRFRVARPVARSAPRAHAVELWVEEGRVAVSRRGRLLSVVGAGGHWDAAPVPAASARRAVASRKVAARTRVAEAPRADSDSSSTPVVTRPRCAVLADETATAREAVACYLEQSHRDGVAAETALYEVARLRRDLLGDAEGAFAALSESRTRFPRGMLRQEVDLSIVELLPKLNRHGEAIEEIGRLLAEGHGEERAAELHVLRGNIYREVLEDFVRAERDYAAAESARAPAVGDATFLRGVCLQALGRADLARAAFERYLASHTTRFADEARRRLERLN